ncbi:MULTISPECIES: DUF1854 domain-containing protein [unclassified Massilia]|uniref:cyanophycin metabolism-associated DUF1854 family protein n=1 Tax=unclassified Massilia TaxID=2609279 RepID=UPI001B83867B|nr:MULTISPECIES: DUF1854 domain-containing protein [unclassified Massilia]MBQ5942138.1 DUF1854 domain-containing protein [Massilia sp. AB1]MBQ5965681.1 DUF1854 domain-containing protein [Massilia sp. ZL223]
MATNFQLRRDSFGKLVITLESGEEHVGVIPVRAFPIQAPTKGISLVRDGGKEVAWIDDLLDVPEQIRNLVQEEIEGREFIPEILHIRDVSSFATPCTWFVKTDRGETEFVLKVDEDIRRVGEASLLVADSHGINFLVRDMYRIDKHSRKILDRFL